MSKDAMTIRIDGKDLFQPLKSLAKDQSLELAGLDPNSTRSFSSTMKTTITE